MKNIIKFSEYKLNEADEPEITILKGINNSGDTQVQSGQTQVQPAQVQSGQNQAQPVQSSTGQTEAPTPEEKIEPEKPISKKIPKDIFIEVKNNDERIIKSLINVLSLIISKRKLRNLRIIKITGELNKLEISDLKYSKLDIVMSNNDKIKAEFTLPLNKIACIKITINDKVIYDLEHKSFTLELMIVKISDNYIKYLQSKKWKVNKDEEL